MPPQASNSSRASRTARTSWTRRICTPWRASASAPPIVPAVRSAVLVADHLADEALARVADQQRAAQVVKPPAVGHQREVVLVRLAEADAGVEADPLAVDAGGDQRIAPLAEVRRRFRRPRRRRTGRPASSAACPACASRRRRAPICAATSIIAGSPVRPVTSLMISAPAATAASATAAFEVSIERIARGRC